MSEIAHRNVFVSAGEASSDAHAAGLVDALSKQVPGLQFFGMGGSSLRGIGVETIVDAEAEASVMGLVEVFGSVFRLIGAYRALLGQIRRRKPTLAILVDFPDFNFLLARALKREGVKVVYFISPQIWAWRKGRIKTIRKYVDCMLTIFPFESQFYRRQGVEAHYVGHPFLDRSPVKDDREDFLQNCGLDPKKPVLALLPGSRKSEFERLIEPLQDALVCLLRVRPDIQAILPVAATLELEWVKEQIDGKLPIQLTQGQAREVLAFANFAVVASGTATVEAALAKIPFVCVYKLSPITYLIARQLIRGVKYFCMPNLIAEKQVIPELLQSDVDGEQIAEEIKTLMNEPARREQLLDGLAEVERRLRVEHSSSGTAVACAAEHVAKLL